MNIINIIYAQTTAEKAVGEAIASSFGFNLVDIFSWAIGVGAVLALGAITWGGIKISTSELAHQKEDGKEWIKSAIFGLILLLGAFLILSTINPEILRF